MRFNRIPTEGDGRFYAGQRVGFAAELTSDSGLRGIEAGAKTTLGGCYRNRENSSMSAGVATEFSYRDLRRIARSASGTSRRRWRWGRASTSSSAAVT